MLTRQHTETFFAVFKKLNLIQENLETIYSIMTMYQLISLFCYMIDYLSVQDWVHSHPQPCNKQIGLDGNVSNFTHNVLIWILAGT
jgi:hypothetical protein